MSPHPSSYPPPLSHSHCSVAAAQTDTQNRGRGQRQTQLADRETQECQTDRLTAVCPAGISSVCAQPQPQPLMDPAAVTEDKDGGQTR